MKKILMTGIIIFCLVFLPISASAIDTSCYTDFVDQGIIFSPGKAYYPTVIHDGANYLMLYDKPASYATSTDGIAWTSGGAVTGLTNPMHMIMLYDANEFDGGGYNYKIWYFDSKAAIPNGANSIRYAESTNGIIWNNDQAVFGGNMITSGDDNVDAPSRTWGPGAVLYNPDATNTGDNPMDYSYVMYYDGYNGNTGDSEWDNTEALFLAYSADGISWNRYTTSPVLKGGSAGEWDNGGVGYPTVMKIEDTYIMWYGGGAGTNKGIGFATSPDGITWTKDGSNPMFHVSDVTDPVGYRAKRTYTPRVIDDGSGILKMYYSAKSSSDVYAIGLASATTPKNIVPDHSYEANPKAGKHFFSVFNLGPGGTTPIAEISTEDSHTGRQSVHLYTAYYDFARVLTQINSRKKLDDITSIGFWYKHLPGSNDATPHVVINFALADGGELQICQWSDIDMGSLNTDWTFFDNDDWYYWYMDSSTNYEWWVDTGHYSLADIQDDFDGTILFAYISNFFDFGPFGLWAHGCDVLVDDLIIK